ncbi:unnamed protein product, partial [Symbiodinium sp. CCMP2592]
DESESSGGAISMNSESAYNSDGEPAAVSPQRNHHHDYLDYDCLDVLGEFYYVVLYMLADVDLYLALNVDVDFYFALDVVFLLHIDVDLYLECYHL